MKLLIYGVFAMVTAMPAVAADVGVSISIGDPNFYGQIDIGNFPRPRLLYPSPIVIERDHYRREPMYLRVPPGHAKHWSQHCREYGACGRPVYFVEDGWYRNDYAPRYRNHHRDSHNDYRHDNYDNDSGHGHGNGHGKGKGHDK